MRESQDLPCQQLCVPHLLSDMFQTTGFMRKCCKGRSLILRSIPSFTEKEDKNRFLILLEFLGTSGAVNKIIMNTI